jgi:tagatose-6-phosphate ketose/aldose isomerase
MNQSPMISTGSITYAEIMRQPELWLTTADRMRHAVPDWQAGAGPVIVAGAGTSAHASSAVAAAWPEARAIPTTDLVLDVRPYFPQGGVLISLARSGDSPESVGVVELVQKQCPEVRHIAITCNAQGRLANAPGVEVILLDPRTNDRGLAMTSSFSNLVLAGLCLRHQSAIDHALPAIVTRAQAALAEMDERADRIARVAVSRMTVLASPPMEGAAREAALKVLEMTGGNLVTIPETFLGLRHGPMSFLRQDSLVLCFLSSSAQRRKYEEDLLAELRLKTLGRIVAIVPDGADASLVDEAILANAPELPDMLRTPFEIVFAQLLAYHFSLHAGFDPDNPSPDGVITRVVQGIRIHGE